MAVGARTVVVAWGVLAAALCAARVAVAQVGECAGACPAPALAPAEAALHRAVHLSWSDPHRRSARRYEISRRSAGDWEVVAQVPGDRPTHHDDAGPESRGLAPAGYEYRVRGLHRVGAREVWSEWSGAQRVQVREACREAGGELAPQPRVVAEDLDRDGRYTGADLERALHACSKLGGCVLEALPVTYDDVAIVISDGDPTACSGNGNRTACLTDPFPNGLAIEGHGASTVLRSPLWNAPYMPAPILEIWRRPDLRVALRHLVLDGRKTEQRDPIPGENNSNGWRHFGFGVWNRWSDHDKPNRNGCVHDVVARNLFTKGISVQDVARWNIEYSTIEDIGCARTLTPCSRLTVPARFGPDYTSTGFGIYIDWHSDDVLVRANQIRRSTKYAMSIKHGQDGSEATIRRLRVEDNDMDESGQLGIFVGGVADALFVRNRIARTDSLSQEARTRSYNDTFGISCNGIAERTGFQNNRIEDSDGMAIQWSCSGKGNYVAATRISGSCRRKGPKSCSDKRGRECYNFPDIWVNDTAAGELSLIDNEVSGSKCSAPLAIDLTQPDIDVRVSGGRYAAGRDATAPVRFLAAKVLVDRGASFSGAPLKFGPGTLGIVAPDVSVTGTDEPYQVDWNANVLLCPEDERECQKRCSAAKPPIWCTPPPKAR